MAVYKVEVTTVTKLEAESPADAIVKVCDLLRKADKSSATLLHLEITDVHGAPLIYKETT